MLGSLLGTTSKESLVFAVCMNVGEYATAIMLSQREILPENRADTGRIWVPAGAGRGGDKGQEQVPRDTAGALVSPDLKQPFNVTFPGLSRAYKCN